MPNYDDLAVVAAEAAAHAANYIRSTDLPRDDAAWARKGAGLSDFVTHVDRAAEQIIREHLTRAAPEATVIGEELSPDGAMNGLLWIVDPLDGTTNYLHEFPAYAVSIAAVEDGVPLAGVVHDVVKDIAYSATQGGGAWTGNTQMTVSPRTEPGAALIGTGFPFKNLDLLPTYLAQFSSILTQTAGIRRAGSAALDLVDVALGRFDGFWELRLAPWDVAAGVLLVREAGGVVTNAAGSSDVVRHTSIIAGNPAIHEFLMSVVGT